MTPRRYLPALLLLFVGSGCAALIYEIVWFQLLELVIGSSAISLGILLGTFMGGMCAGSLLLPRLVSPRHHPLHVYALIEIAIGAIALLVLAAVPLVGSVYTAWAGSGTAGIILRAAAAGVCLLPPTLLMGATLPAISRWVKATPEGVSWLGFFYGGNIAGGVIGCLLAGFYLLRLYDTTTSTLVAVAINVVVAALAFVLSRLAEYQPADEVPANAPPPTGARLAYVAIALSGVTALGAEVIWTRMLSLLFGGTVYTFAQILAVFLIGLGIGSTVGSVIARDSVSPRIALGWCQMLACAALAWAAYMTTESLPYWPINPSMNTSPWFTFQLDFVRCLWVVLPGAMLWGASFPLALAAVASRDQDAARLAGGMYAANTVGAIVGSLGVSFILIPWVGSQHAQQVLIAMSALSGLLMLEPVYAASPIREQVRLKPDTTEGRRRPSLVPSIALAAAMVAAALLLRSVPPLPGVLVAYGRFAAARIGQADVFYTGEGINASVAVSRLGNGVLNYHNAGKVQASSEPQDMRLQRMLGHLTTLIPASPKDVLVIGCGAGVTAGAVSIDPAVERQTIVEIEPLVPEVVSTYFGEQNFNVVRNPKVRIEIDDARHFLLTTDRKFDAITSDPLDPWVKGAAMLYTTEFFTLVKDRLNPGGVVTLFVQLYESNLAAVKSEIATFLEVFPNGVVFGNTQEGRGYDLVLLGQVEPTRIDVDDIEARLNRPEYEPIKQSLAEIGMRSAIDLFSTYAGSKADLEPWLADAVINRDRNLRLQYLAGLGLNLYQADTIYASMLQYGDRPTSLFVGSEDTMRALLEGIDRAQAQAR
jgi:spermidine synthase